MTRDILVHIPTERSARPTIKVNLACAGTSGPYQCNRDRLAAATIVVAAAITKEFRMRFFSNSQARQFFSWPGFERVDANQRAGASRRA